MYQKVMKKKKKNHRDCQNHQKNHRCRNNNKVEEKNKGKSIHRESNGQAVEEENIRPDPAFADLLFSLVLQNTPSFAILLLIILQLKLSLCCWTPSLPPLNFFFTIKKKKEKRTFLSFFLFLEFLITADTIKSLRISYNFRLGWVFLVFLC